jgi:hypothetical protein
MRSAAHSTSRRGKTEPFCLPFAPCGSEGIVRRAFLVLAAVILSLSAGFAQAQDSRGSIAGIVGAGKTWDDESDIGSGLAVGGRVDWRLFGGTRAEFAFDTLDHDRSGVFASNGRSSLVSGSLLQRFGAGAAQPYVLGGLTATHHSGTTSFEDLARSTSTLDVGFHFGGGLAVRAGERFEIGPEARFYIISASDDAAPAWAYWIGARLGVRF